MKTALVLSALVAVLQPQQQTFHSAKAEPKPVPAHTAQPVNPDYLYYRAHHGKPSPRPSHRPAPRHT